MNPRVITAAVGSFMVLLGMAALLEPEMVMERVLGFAVDPKSTENFVHGEVRAAYGGIFTVVGVFTVMAAMNPYLHRSRILMVGMIWLGACGGRVFGAFSDGTPGAFGWASAVLEGIVGAALLVAAQTAAPPAELEGAVRPIKTSPSSAATADPAPEPPAA